MNFISSRIVRDAALPLSVGILAAVEGTTLFSDDTPSSAHESGHHKHSNYLISSTQWMIRSSNSTTRMESAKAYDHDPKDFDYYVKHPTVDDLPILLKKFDDDGLEVWPWIWTHPNEDGPHYVFLGETISSSVVLRIQELRKQSPQNNILIVISDDESALHRAAKEAGAETDIFDKCHCGIVTGVNLELLHVRNKILMLDDERVIAFDYLTIC
jgi:hypothetical protein